MTFTPDQMAALAELGAAHGMTDPDSLKLLDLSAIGFDDARPVLPRDFWTKARQAKPHLFPNNAMAMTSAQYRGTRARMVRDAVLKRQSNSVAATMRRLEAKYANKGN